MAVPAGPVLIAYDGSEDAALAIARAGALLAPREALLVHVWDSLAALLLHTDVSRLTGTMRDAADELDAEGARRADEIVAAGVELAREAGFEPQGRRERGTPKAWPTLLAAADEADAAVVVIGSRGLGGVRSALLGSVSSRLLHHCTRPVLVVPPGEDAGGPVIVGYDGSEDARSAVRAAARLLSPREVLVQTVWVPYSAVAGTAVAGEPAATLPAAAVEIDRELAAGAARRAAEGASLATAEGLQASSGAVGGTANVWPTLVDSAREHAATAVVVGARGRSGLSAALLGSVSTGVVHHASAPVLVVPAAR